MLTTLNEGAFWVSQGRRFRYKWQALQAAGSPSELTFHLYDDAFKRLDWTQEPEASFSELLMERARQIRESYRYVALFYGGGVDSHTMIQGFLNAGLQIDEIIVFRISPIDQFQGGIANCELEEVALPYLNSIKNLLRGTVITVLDIGHRQFSEFYRRPGWSTELNSVAFRMTEPKQILAHHLKGLDFFLKDGVCNVWGGDKPRLCKKDGVFYAYNWDGARSRFMNFPGLEEFYISPDFPEIHAKQCHMVKNYLKTNYSERDDVDFFFKPIEPFVSELNAACRFPLYRNISVGKNFELTPKNRENLEQAKQQLPIVYEGFKDELDYYQKRFAHLYNRANVVNHLIGVPSHRYSLGR